MTAEALPASTPQMERDAGWRDIAAVLGARALTRLRKITSAIRPLAWVLMALAVGFWVLGQTAGWAEFTIAAVVVAIAVVLCALFLIGRTAYDVALDLARTRVVVGERAVGALTLANRGTRAILPSRVVLPVGAGRGEFGIQRLAPGEETEELFAIPTQKRGVVKVGPVSVVRGDPLGLFERAHRRDDPVDLFVHPRTVLFDGQSLGYLRDLEGLPAADLSRDDVSFHALLEYQPGDDLRHVHWRSTARTGTMMVRQYEETRRSHFVIGLSRSLADYATEDDFELGVSAAGSIGLRALRDSQRVDMRVQGRELPAGTGKQLLDSLSAVENSKPKEGGIAELAGVVSATMPLASVVVLVCGARVKSDDLRLACARLPFGARVLVVVADTTASAPALRRIGDADVVTVGALEQVPLALQKVLA
ncbi:DUF58 domain-containing protein [Microbacterium sp.]|uniref:DUF58 domain-containing protein n=1 Tax=Microbacterium sp. TaxID=51671 RepID=UPI00262E6A12|nr:DUF58 domain-containing protein [Microbacterium sp.]MCV0334317.1 DUF58 domain-containing protein [Microbacterium sp.]MCV0376143.1 DUF58 domain-containing protein [Microbacterium sp.]MCV0390057.1 DUF58 domain-containing protein [Microbacterium sp.]MCV0417792.1 DUF58 domain-containing protein [Microbacterium sp.]MCV0422540.1 DUF58 domain-containing protein [Microbacterium sp.]